jgi:alanyl-tRNA synthetase
MVQIALPFSGIVRLYYVAGVRTIDVLKNESEMITSLQKLWGIPKNQIVTEAEKIFTEKKHFESEYLVPNHISLSDHQSRIDQVTDAICC